MSSVSVRFNSFLLYSIFNEHFVNLLIDLVGLDGLEPSTSRLSGVRSNHLSYRPFPLVVPRSFPSGSPLGDLVEMMGFEPMTPCLQGRCSPS